ncbi:armadillo-type protein [Chaetomidium leptoderma]|uniref:Armadillo-type protein n=1 Tax=Chaetomidium leptoderma TaxID=669021 RepID=A0AAN6VCT3_9PEZI|nr:armadillo-type protein [Chaetomidium leptoderma]
MSAATAVLGPGAALAGSPDEFYAAASKSSSLDENSNNSEEFVAYDSKETTAALSCKSTVSPLTTSKLASQNFSNHSILQQRQDALKEMQKAADDENLYTRGFDNQSSCSSLPLTPGIEGFSAPTAPTAPTTRSASATPGEGQVNTEEVLRLKLELAQAQNRISRLDQELSQTRIVNPESGCASPALVPEHDYASAMAPPASPATSRISVGNMAFNAPGKMQPFSRELSWITHDDAPSDIGDSLPAAGLNRSRGIWNNSKPAFGSPFPQGQGMMDGTQPMPWPNNRVANYDPALTPLGMDSYRQDRMVSDQDMMRPIARRGHRYDNNRYGSSNNFGGSFNNFSMSPSPYEMGQGYSAGPQPMMNSGMGMGMGMYSPYQQQPVGTALSPHATEFTSLGSSWKGDTLTSDGQTYVSPTTEPLNYRRLLDRNVTCDWKYIVDKIVCNNDQQASIFLQQKLKVGTPEQKYDIVEAIVAQAYPLMVNRFGNFLVQRCFEHGTPEQVIKIAQSIRGNTLNLSMDPFGCHVVQKAFDSVPEDYKAIMVHELLRRIPETVMHRYACHVWQKLFELRWTESPPQIMKYVNEALRGMWHEVSLGETGSLVVQNIFENCLEEDKRPCIEEVLANIDIVAHGQFGNWCIQHICEHGAPADRSRAIDHVIRYAAEYSMDQFASKVVEKCLKIGGPDFLSRYLDRVCEGRLDRPRIPLIDIASDQYGNYLIQYILTHAAPQHREIVAAHIRKHMVSLRGSKFGSRVGMLCTNHAAATRPGPAVGPMPGRMASSRYTGGYR